MLCLAAPDKIEKVIALSGCSRPLGFSELFSDEPSLGEADQRLLLSAVIKHIYAERPARFRAMRGAEHGLFSLCSEALFSGRDIRLSQKSGLNSIETEALNVCSVFLRLIGSIGGGTDAGGVVGTEPLKLLPPFQALAARRFDALASHSDCLTLDGSAAAHVLFTCAAAAALKRGMSVFVADDGSRELPALLKELDAKARTGDSVPERRSGLGLRELDALYILDSALAKPDTARFQALFGCGELCSCGGEELVWFDFISDFRYIEPWFSGLDGFGAWASRADELLALRQNLDGTELLAYHPLNAVRESALRFLSALARRLSTPGFSAASSFYTDITSRSLPSAALERAEKELAGIRLPCSEADTARLAHSLLAYNVSSCEAFPFSRGIRSLLKPLPYISHSEDKPAASAAEPSAQPAVFLPPPESRSLSGFALFKLCPLAYFCDKTQKLYYTGRVQLRAYAEAVMLRGILGSLATYDTDTQTVWQKRDSACLELLYKLKSGCSDKIREYFSFFGEDELASIFECAFRRAARYIDESCRGIRGEDFTLIPFENEPCDCGSFSLDSGRALLFVDYSNKVRRLCALGMYTDFIASAAYETGCRQPHYNGILAELDGDACADRVGLALRMAEKIAIQLESKRFAADGLARAKELAAEIDGCEFSSDKAIPGRHCKYCRAYPLCPRAERS